MIRERIEPIRIFLRDYRLRIAVGLWTLMVLSLGLAISLDFVAGVETLMVRAYVSPATGASDPQTAATAELDSPNTLKLEARVTYVSRAVRGANLDAVLHGEHGSEGSVPLNTTNDVGVSTTLIPASLGDDTVSQIVVRAHVRSADLDDVHRDMLTAPTGEDSIDPVLQTTTSFQVVEGSSRAAPRTPDTKWWLPPSIGIVFITTLIFAPWMGLNTARVLTLLHCSVMLGAFAYGYGYVMDTIAPGEVLQLSFGYVCWGSYSDSAPTWLFVVGTSGPSTNPPSMIGAPLWVMFVSVLGSVLLVVSLLIDFNSKTESEVTAHKRTDIALLIRHQFYIMFSPVGAVFVYQALAEANLLDRKLLVAVTSLVAGTAINFVLDFGMERVQRLFTRAEGAANEAETNADASTTDSELVDVEEPRQPSEPAHVLVTSGPRGLPEKPAQAKEQSG